MATGGWAWVAEVAGEELARLEAAHPGRFGPLKADLQRLVAGPVLDADAFAPLTPRAAAEHGLDAAAALLPPRAGEAAPSSQSAPPPALMHLSSTQESSTRKRRPAGAGACERKDGKRRRGSATKDRADMAIERAERCLERIRAIKRSLLAGWTH